MFDPHFEYCSLCRAPVLLDQTQRRCARDHDCKDLSQCVLRRFFTGIEFREIYASGRLKIKGCNTRD